MADQEAIEADAAQSSPWGQYSNGRNGLVDTYFRCGEFATLVGRGSIPSGDDGAVIAEGLANKEIAYRLGISEHTVKFHVSAMLGKLGAGSRAEAIGSGVRQGAIML